MDVREKLVELIDDYTDRLSVQDIHKADFAEKFADRLIADGWTKQEWISVKDRLPEEESLYLVAVVNDHERRYSKTAWYHGHGNWFLHQKVTHWQYLPQPPKGE